MYADIVEILRSLDSVAGVVVQIRAELWGEAYAAEAEKPEWQGIIDRWSSAEKDALYIKWEGYNRNQLTPLDSMDKMASGASLQLKLLPYQDGRPAPTLQQQTASSNGDQHTSTSSAHRPQRSNGAAQQRRAADDNDRLEGLREGDVVESKGIMWKLRSPEYVSEDARTESRTKPKLNTLGKDVSTMTKLFYHLLPAKWGELIIKYTNPLLDDSDLTNAKLTKGELHRFFGYMLAMGVHSGVSLNKMWKRVSDMDSSAPPPNMGRFGMTKHRFNQLRRVLRFGPSDEESFAKDSWCFVEQLVETFNQHNLEAVDAGWLLAVDELMIGWRGKVRV